MGPQGVLEGGRGKIKAFGHAADPPGNRENPLSEPHRGAYVAPWGPLGPHGGAHGAPGGPMGPMGPQIVPVWQHRGASCRYGHTGAGP